MRKRWLYFCVVWLLLLPAASAARRALEIKQGLRFEYAVTFDLEQKNPQLRIEQKQPAKQLVFSLANGRMAFAEWFQPESGVILKGTESTPMKPKAGRPPNAVVIERPQFWPQPSILTFYVKQPHYYLQEIATFPQRIIDLADMQRRDGKPLPRVAAFATPGVTGEFRIVDELPAAPVAAAVRDVLGEIEPVSYRGQVSFTVHEKRNPAFEGSPQPGWFEITLDRKSGALLWLKTVLHVPKRAALVTEAREVRLQTVARVDADEVQRAVERFRQFDEAYQSGRLEIASRIAEQPSLGTTFDDIVQDRLKRLRDAAPLLAQALPPLPFTDVRGVEGDTAEARVQKLRAMMQGRAVLFDFWATWCGPCIQGMVHTVAAGRQAGGPVVVAATLLDDKNPLPKVEEFIATGYEKVHKERFSGIVAIMADRPAYKKIVSGGIPYYVVVDGKGIVRYQAAGDTAWEMAISVAKALAQ